jgi:hypothetical protein
MAKKIGLKTIPWMLLLDVAMLLRTQWGRLNPRDRRELGRIVKKSAGNPRNLSQKERSELLRIVRELDLITAGRTLLPFHGGVPRARRP